MPKKGEDRKFNANGQNGWSDMSDHVALRKGLYMDFYHTYLNVVIIRKNTKFLATKANKLGII